MAELVKRNYGGFRGVDFRGEEVNLLRSPDAVNMYKDYREVDSIRTRPRLKIRHFDNFHVSEHSPIGGMHYFNVGDKKEVVLHLAGLLTPYKLDTFEKVGNKSWSYGGESSVSFVFNNILYILTGEAYVKYDGTEIKRVWMEDSYVPTTSIGRKPSGGGTVCEDVNMLSDLRINTFIGDGESTEYYLDAKDVKYISSVEINGEEVLNKNFYSLDSAEGKVTFNSPPSKPLTDGQDNVKIKYWKRVEGYFEKIEKCTIAQVFDNRVFLSGNPDYPNVVFHSSLNDPTYFSDLDYYTDGLDSGKVRSLVAGNNALWVFKEPNMANTTIFYHIPTIDSEYGKIYPSTHSSISTGCVGRAINFNDDIVFFSERGMEGVNGDITTEQAVEHRSSLVDRKLLAEEDYQNMILREWDGYLLVVIGNKVYLADSRAKFTNEDHYEYEWFYWDFGSDYFTSNYGCYGFIQGFSAVEYIEGKLYLCAIADHDKGGTDNFGHTGAIVFELDVEQGLKPRNATNDTVISYWTTPKDKFKFPNMQKTTNKRGCVVEAKGDLYVKVKTDKDMYFQTLNEYENITDAFCCRIKKKKFKDIQLQFYSDGGGSNPPNDPNHPVHGGFSLESATLECFVGGYLKNL